MPAVLRARLRFALLGLVLGAPFVVVAVAAGKLADAWATDAGRLLSEAVGRLPSASEPSAALEDDGDAAALGGAPDVLATGAGAKAPTGRGKTRRGGAPAPAGAPDLFVSARTVLRLADSSARPRGTPVGKT